MTLYKKKLLWVLCVAGICIIALVIQQSKTQSLDETMQPILKGNSQTKFSKSAMSDPQACVVESLQKSPEQAFKIDSPDGTHYLLNKNDSNGVGQIYVGRTGSSALTCISCLQQPGGSKPERSKMEPVWDASGKWIFTAVERDQYATPPILGSNKDYVRGQLENGIWTDMWAVSPDGKQWTRLTNFKSGVPGTADGYTGPAFTPDGKKAVWSQIIDGNIFSYWPFGRWQLILADVGEKNGVPVFTNQKDITPKGMAWNEPGNFSPDNQSLLLSGSVEKDTEGMDQYILNINTGKLTNLTNSPAIWDEHGVFSPDGNKILFMSAYPYRSDPNSSKTLTIKTDFMLMDKDGSGLMQITHFRTPSYPEFSNGIAANGFWSNDGRSLNLKQLFFPNYVIWDLTFKGACGG